MATAGPRIMYLDGTRSGYVSLKVSQDLERASDETLRALGIGALVWDGGSERTRKVIRVTAAAPHVVNMRKRHTLAGRCNAHRDVPGTDPHEYTLTGRRDYGWVLRRNEIAAGLLPPLMDYGRA